MATLKTLRIQGKDEKTGKEPLRPFDLVHVPKISMKEEKKREREERKFLVRKKLQKTRGAF